MTPEIKYGLDAFVLPAPYSLLVSLLMVAGCGLIGYLLLANTPGLKAVVRAGDMFLAAPALGCAAVAATFYPLLLYKVLSGVIMAALAWLLGILGMSALAIVTVVLLRRRVALWSSSLKAIRIESVIAFFLLAMFGIVAASPVTSGDALAYHLKVAMEILNSGEMPAFQHWAMGRLGGAGEFLIAIGLAVGAEQFGSLIEYCGLLAIYAAIGIAADGPEFLGTPNSSTRFIRLCAVSLPVYLFLISTPKPQLLPIGLNLFALALVVAAYFEPKTSNAQTRWLFFLACALLIVSTWMKFTFLLSSALIGAYAIWMTSRKDMRETGACSLLALLLLLVLFLPVQWWKYVQYGGSIFSTFLSPLVGNFPGDDRVLIGLQQYKDSAAGFFPLNIIIPFTANSISMVLGLATAVAFFLVGKLTERSTRPFLFLLLAQVFILVTFGPAQGRYFVEPLLWALLLFSRFPLPANVGFRVFRRIITFQSLAVLMAGTYAAALFFPGSLNSDARRSILRQYADGYVLADWIDKQLPPDAVLLSGNHALSVIPRRTLSLDWLYFLTAYDLPALRNSIPEELRYHSQYIQAAGTGFVLIVGDTYRSELKNCLGTPVAEEPRLYRWAGRNPFVDRGEYRPVALYHLNAAKLPTCLSLPSAKLTFPVG
jgi:hypothetical protein